MSGVLSSLDGLIPVSVLTGFLGSGKTTTLNALVRSPEMARALVIINEFGEVGLDHDLVAQGHEEMKVEMIGGCLCCTIRGDLLATLRDAPWRFAREGRCWFDRVVIETTGLADPAPILHTLMRDHTLETIYRLDSVIATVDAVNGAATLERQEEAVKQAAIADRILLTKIDLVGEPEREALTARLRSLNPAAPILPVKHGAVAAHELFGGGAFDPAGKSADVQDWLRAEAYADHTHAHDHAHDVNRHGPDIRATCLTFDEPLDPETFERWIELLTWMRGEDILRIKGILNLEGQAGPVVVHGVQHVFHPPVVLKEWPSDDRRTRLVFITRGLDGPALEETFAMFRPEPVPDATADAVTAGGTLTGWMR
ncbi:CobW family GTP-binding protein [Novosphingobium profundi]|uniref:CobW family GTP-binding protein n=1 Tax=Novosphingobium profundi TaxID=1774954 RepID=UPI001CFD26F0|nr:GTP-binding protein [Novosphingobium profundi]